MSKVKIQIKNVEKKFISSKNETRSAVTGVNLDINEGEFICLLGPSGCGKTTLLNLMAGFDKPSYGEITIDGACVEATNPKFITIFQDYALFPWRNVLGNVEYGLEAKGVPKEKRREIAHQYINLVGLEKFINSHPSELSGGMKQRTALARALALSPGLLLMDEPFGSLDAQARMELQTMLLEIWEKSANTIVFVTHDISEALTLSDRILIMSRSSKGIKEIVDNTLPRPRLPQHKGYGELWQRIFDDIEVLK